MRPREGSGTWRTGPTSPTPRLSLAHRGSRPSRRACERIVGVVLPGDILGAIGFALEAGYSSGVVCLRGFCSYQRPFSTNNLRSVKQPRLGSSSARPEGSLARENAQQRSAARVRPARDGSCSAPRTCRGESSPTTLPLLFTTGKALWADSVTIFTRAAQGVLSGTGAPAPAPVRPPARSSDLSGALWSRTQGPYASGLPRRSAVTI